MPLDAALHVRCNQTGDILRFWQHSCLKRLAACARRVYRCAPPHNSRVVHFAGLQETREPLDDEPEAPL